MEAEKLNLFINNLENLVEAKWEELRENQQEYLTALIPICIND